MDNWIRNDYYPFGLKHKGYNNVVNGTHYPFGYNGKEENDELGLEWLDFGARNYDASLGRWMNLDPLTELMRRHSPYNYAFDNPVYFIDPDGMAPFGSCCGIFDNSSVVKSLRTVKETISKGIKKLKSLSFSTSSSSSSSGSKSNSNKGGVMLSNDSGGATGDQSMIRSADRTAVNGDVPWVEVGDAVNALSSYAGSGFKGPKGNKGQMKKGDGKTNATNVNAKSKASDTARAFKNGQDDAGNAVNVTTGLAGSVETSNTKDADTTFTTLRANGFETRVVSPNQTFSTPNIERVKVTVPKSKVDSVNKASEDGLNKQLKDMQESNSKLLKEISNN